MKLLFRHKKKEVEGFKKYVEDLETSPFKKKVEKFQMAALEDPIYMYWVAMNIFNMRHFFNLDAGDVEVIIESIKEWEKVLVNAFHKSLYEPELIPILNKLKPDIKEKYDYQITLTGTESISPEMNEKNQFSIIKTFRRLQKSQTVSGHPWKLPEDFNILKPRKINNPSGPFTLTFENGQLALEGELKKTQRIGPWKHFFPNGKLMASGEYKDDELNGEWVFYYPNGLKKAQGSFEESKKIGKWQEWDRSNREFTQEYTETE